MITELRPSEFERVLPLYRRANLRFPLISAVIQQKQRGQVFVDERARPGSAIVITNFGFTFFVGDDQNARFDDSLIQLLAAGEHIKPSYLLWYSPPAGWQRKLDAGVPDRIKLRERIRLDFHAKSENGLTDQIPSPDGFHFEDLSLEMIPKTEKFGVKLDSRFWASAEDCVKNSVGVCLVKDGEVVSLCYAAALVDGLAEVDVATEPEYRGRGLATVVVRQFIKRCLERQINPTWDCFDYNTASVGLAKKLGFEPVSRYPFYTFNIPLRMTNDKTGS